MIYGSSCHIMNDYETISLNSLRNHTNNILILKGKTNKTKCVAINPIYENETLFSFKENEIISSEFSDFPEKDAIYRFLSEITSDQIMKNKIIVVLYILYEMNNSTNIIMNSTPRKYLTDKRINRNSSALMIKPGMALDTNYGRKYNMNYESSNNNSKNESGLNYDYKSQNDYNNNDWIYNNDDKKLNLDPQ